MACLGEDAVVDYVEGRLSAEGAAAIVAHTDGCEACRELVAATAAAFVSSGRSAGRGAGETAPLAAGAAVGRYLVVGLLGSGGMGVVYAAYDPELDRKVALKLLRADLLLADDGEDADPIGSAPRARLQREAQAMARLRHPNVIAVHDVGTFGERIFIAMELIDGTTLGEWRRARRRSWREVVRVAALAGRGLAAAHAAGLVHRDFKPDNVLIGADGRVCVTDFGLARPASAVEPAADVAIAADSALHSPLTRSGALVGTPAYMAPEQMDGAPVDARADQFSFAVALYEALYGARPFAGATVRELRESIRAEKIAEPDDGARVPAWVRRVVARGLHAKPDKRWPSLEALLAALERDPRRRVAVAVGVVALVALAGAGAWGLEARARRHELQCKGAERKLAGVWDAARRERAHAAFRASGRAWAEESFRAVDEALAAQAARWALVHTDACEATRLRGEQSEELLDLRMQCLDERRKELDALAAAFASADAALVDQAAAAANALRPLDGCSNAEALRARVRPPSSPADRARAQALEARVAELRALDDTGRYQQVVDGARAILDDARPLAYAPLEADALYMLGVGQDRLGDPRGAAVSLQAAAVAAERGRHDEAAARAWYQLVYVVGCELSRPSEGDTWARYAEAAIDRLGGSDELMSNLLHSRGSLRWAERRYPEAVDDYRRSLALAERVFGAGDYRIAGLLSDLGAVLTLEQKLDEGGAAFERAIAIAERTLGPRHTGSAIPKANLGVLRTQQLRLDEGERWLREALEVQTAALGADSARITWPMNGLGVVERLRGRAADALVHHRRALELRERAMGAASPQVQAPLVESARDLIALGRPSEALPLLERAGKLPGLRPLDRGELALATAQALAALRRDPARVHALLVEAKPALAERAAVPLYRAELDEIGRLLR